MDLTSKFNMVGESTTKTGETSMEKLTRRKFLGSLGMTIAAGGFAGMSLREAMAQPVEKLAENVPTRILGRTGWESKIIGLGTIFRPVGGKWMTTQESDYLLNMMIDNGINLFEIGVVYKDSEDWMGRVIPKHSRDKLFISSKSTKITKDGFLKDLDNSLIKLKTDHLDNYMLHNYSSFIDYEKVMGEGGAFEGLKQAQKEGKTRFIGITSHGCPVIMAAMRSKQFDVHLLPYNAAHREFGRALDLAAKLDAGMLIMKPYGGSGLLSYNANNPKQLPQTLTPEECLRYVLSHPGVDVAVPNMASPEQFKQALAAAATFKPLTPNERKAIEAKAARITGGVCSECPAPCDKACPCNVPIRQLMSSVQEMSRLSYDRRRQGDVYAALPHDFMDCDGCGECEKVCPKKFGIRKDLESYQNQYRECRARAVIEFQQIYR